MNFNDFWNRVKDSGDLQLETKKHKKPFNMHYDDTNDSIVVVPQKTKKMTPNTISKNLFEDAWESVIGKMEPFRAMHYQKDFSRRASYFGPIMEHFLSGEEIE